jgi:hypothetical protein
MIPAAIARALRSPPLEARDFTPTKFSTAEEKAWFGNTLLKFLAGDCPLTGLTERLYRRLSMTFGYIAHCDRLGFYQTFFEDDSGKIDFLHQTLRWPCFGDPHYTYRDLERAVIRRLKDSGLLHFYEARLHAANEQAERTEFQRLKAKYDPAADKAPMPPHAPSCDPLTLRQGDLFGLTS